MEELIQKIDEVIVAINSSSTPLWINIVGIFVPIVLSIVVIFITIHQNKINKILQQQICDTNIKLQQELSLKEQKLQMHTDVIKIYEDYCLAQNAVAEFKDKTHIIFSSFYSNSAGLLVPLNAINNLQNSFNIMCMAENRAMILFPESDTCIKERLKEIFLKTRKILDKLADYYLSGIAKSISDIAWQKIVTQGISLGDYVSLMQNQKLYNTYLDMCKNQTTAEIEKQIEDILSLYTYDNFDLYFKKYVQIDSIIGEENNA